MIERTDRKPELLAPAGNLDCALAALQSGADAVYAGISRFNAREMGENFSWDDMSRLSAYTKKNNRKFYLTLNTLIKESELTEFAESVNRIESLKPDAVIIQDIGIARILREYFPNIAIHASTQMGIHNSAGVRTAVRMGIERVILERQLTTLELQEICREPVEIEVFVHGALCCSISGHCLFSSWMGGWSGNRGRCKQPCRRRFHGEEYGTKKSGFFFSTRDFYSLDMIETLTDAGVCSLKIEGRLKKPDYVKSVVTAYRMMLDAPTDQKPKVLKEARNILAGSYGRKWSHGFSTKEDMESVIQYNSAGVSGRLAGTVEKTSKGGFEISVIQRLHIGDRIRIQPKSGDEGPSITITKMSMQRNGVKSATKGSRVFIHCDKEVRPKSMVYKIGESSAETVKRPADLPLFVRPVEIGIKVSASSNGLQAEAISVNGKEPSPPLIWLDEQSIDSAQKRPLSEEDLQTAFSVTRNDRLSAIIKSADPGKGLFLPAGRLKKTRRAFWEWLETQPDITEALKAPSETGKERLEKFKSELSMGIKRTDSSINRSPILPAAYKPLNSASANYFSKEEHIKVSDILNFDENTDEIILPFFCPESRLGELGILIEKAIEAGIRRFRITSLYQFDFFKERAEELFLTSSFPLPSANSIAAAELAELGIGRAQIWLELEKEAVSQAAKAWPVEAEIYRRGKPFLLATRAAVEIEGNITDSRGKAFIVEKNCGADLDFSVPNETGALCCVFPEEVLSLPEIKDCGSYFDLKRTGKTGEKETNFNYDFSLI